jgi:hypothetical protein
MEQIRSSEANVSSANQEIAHILSNSIDQSILYIGDQF